LQEYGETRRGWLGVRIQDVTADVAEAMGLNEARGALVTDVLEGPSKDAGLESGDVILSFDGTDIADTRELVRVVGNSDVGKSVRVVVYRNGATETFLVKLGRREDAEAAVPASIEEPMEPEELNKFGMTLSELTDELRETLGLAEGSSGLLITDVAEDSDAYEKGLRAGDLIAEAGQERVTTIGEFETQIASAEDAGRRSILLLIRRDGEPRFVALGIN
jgi:serine protease Do